ncbi:hypothetical protein [Bartonella sp. TS82HLJMH]|uniref:hypothetical protein n=1 Tax=Bartonella sp. TS82HLJMH TaxID=3243577 RepID=UPI0035D045DA
MIHGKSCSCHLWFFNNIGINFIFCTRFDQFIGFTKPYGRFLCTLNIFYSYRVKNKPDRINALWCWIQDKLLFKISIACRHAMATIILKALNNKRIYLQKLCFAVIIFINISINNANSSCYRGMCLGAITAFAL